jgi:hypothetical protein
MKVYLVMFGWDIDEDGAPIKDVSYDLGSIKTFISLEDAEDYIYECQLDEDLFWSEQDLYYSHVYQMETELN